MISSGDIVTVRNGAPMVIVDVMRNGTVICCWIFEGTPQTAAFDGSTLYLWQKARLN
jgi:uncharacterized protein YodC (DUF2158 family)